MILNSIHRRLDLDLDDRGDLDDSPDYMHAYLKCLHTNIQFKKHLNKVAQMHIKDHNEHQVWYSSPPLQDY